jgi:hypothetical protein
MRRRRNWVRHPKARSGSTVRSGHVEASSPFLTQTLSRTREREQGRISCPKWYSTLRTPPDWIQTFKEGPPPKRSVTRAECGHSRTSRTVVPPNQGCRGTPTSSPNCALGEWGRDKSPVVPILPLGDAPSKILVVSFQTEELMALCVDESLADQRFGHEEAEALRKRLNDVRAADSVLELVAGSPQAGLWKGCECYQIHLGPANRLTIVPNHEKPRHTAVGKIDLPRVWRVCVVEIAA